MIETGSIKEVTDADLVLLWSDHSFNLSMLRAEKQLLMVRDILIMDRGRNTKRGIFSIERKHLNYIYVDGKKEGGQTYSKKPMKRQKKNFHWIV